MFKKYIPLSEPYLSGNEEKYLKECIDTNHVSSVGPFVDRFEKMLSSYIGKKYCVATINCTSALHLSILLSGIKPGEEIIVPALTFVAPINALIYAGAFPLFMDCEEKFLQMDMEKLKEFIEKETVWKKNKLINKNTKRVISGILPVHILGHPVYMDTIVQISEKYKLKLIEDVAEAIGARYNGKKLGNFGIISCFSFNGNKVITTGGGGAILTDDGKIAEKARYLVNQAKDNPIEYIHNEIGYNYRLSNLHSALGCAQLELLDSYIEKRRKINDFYFKAFSENENIRVIREAGWAFSIYWLSTIYLDEKKFQGSRKLMYYLKEKGIESRPLWHPIYKLKPYKKFYSYKIEIADKVYSQCLSLPSSASLKEEEQNFVISQINNFFKKCKNLK